MTLTERGTLALFTERTTFSVGGIVHAASGGDAVLLSKRSPKHLQFSILQRVVGPEDDVIELEKNWKDRLGTRSPSGLNEN